MTNVDKKISVLINLLIQSTRIVAFTGAGISAESGIPTFRGSEGYWTKYDPEKYASIDYFIKDPCYYWRFFRDVRHDAIANASPNKAHYVLAELEKSGKLTSVITQNIDGLHQKAGSNRVLELHGNTNRFYCFNCYKSYSISKAWEKLQKEMPPRCESCSGVLRPDVVLFGELLPMDVVKEAESEMMRCDLMLVVGSSLVVYPAADLPYQAKQRGAKLVIVNKDPTPLDHIADLVINEQAGMVLDKVC